MIIVHLQELSGPKQSICGKRRLEIIRSNQLLVSLDDYLHLKLKPGFKICYNCCNHPKVGLYLLRTL